MGELEDILGDLGDVESLVTGEQGRSREPGSDRDRGAPAADGPGDETDRNRPGAYPESGGSGEGRGFRRATEDLDEDEDLDFEVGDEEDERPADDDDDDDDQDVWEGRDRSRDPLSIAKQERRLRLKAERDLNDLLLKVTSMVTDRPPAAAPAPEVPEEPPITLRAIEDLRAEGKIDEAVAAQARYDEWRDARIRVSATTAGQRQSDYQQLESILERGLDFGGNENYARLVRGTAERLMKRFGRTLKPDQANLAAAALVGAHAFRNKSKSDDLDLREQERRRHDRNRQPRTGPTGRDPEAQSGRVKLSKEVMAGLERFGALDSWRSLSKTPEGRKVLQRRLKRLSGRLEETRAQTRGGR